MKFVTSVQFTQVRPETCTTHGTCGRAPGLPSRSVCRGVPRLARDLNGTRLLRVAELRPHIARSFDRLRTVLHISCCAHAAGTSQLKRSGPIDGARCNQGSMKVTFRSKAATAAARTSGGMPFRRPSKCSSTGVLPE